MPETVLVDVLVDVDVKKINKKKKKEFEINFEEIPKEYRQEFKEFVEMRKRLKKPIKTEQGLSRLLQKLKKYPPGITKQAIEKSIECEYQGIFPESIKPSINNFSEKTYREIPKTSIKELNGVNKYSDEFENKYNLNHHTPGAERDKCWNHYVHKLSGTIRKFQIVQEEGSKINASVLDMSMFKTNDLNAVIA